MNPFRIFERRLITKKNLIISGHVSIINVLTLFTILAMTVPIGPTLIVIFIMRKKVI